MTSPEGGPPSPEPQEVRPSESRIDEVAKAEQMAYAEKPYRDKIAELEESLPTPETAWQEIKALPKTYRAVTSIEKQRMKAEIAGQAAAARYERRRSRRQQAELEIPDQESGPLHPTGTTPEEEDRRAS